MVTAVEVPVELPESDVGAWCQRLYPRLVGVLGLHCGDRFLAEELAQEALTRAWQRWDAVRSADSPEAWAFRVAFNLASSRFRRLAAERRARARLAAARPPAAPDPSDVLAVRGAVAALPPRQRAAVVLRYFADLSVVDTAEVLGCAPGTVKSLCSHGIDHLRRELDIEEAEPARRQGEHRDG